MDRDFIFLFNFRSVKICTSVHCWLLKYMWTIYWNMFNHYWHMIVLQLYTLECLSWSLSICLSVILLNILVRHVCMCVYMIMYAVCVNISICLSLSLLLYLTSLNWSVKYFINLRLSSTIGWLLGLLVGWVFPSSHTHKVIVRICPGILFICMRVHKNFFKKNLCVTYFIRQRCVNVCVLV